MKARSVSVASALAASILASGQDYGGGWATPSLDTAISIGNEIVNREIILDLATQSLGKGKGNPSGRSGSAASERRASRAKTAFRRSPAVTKAVQAEFVRAVAARGDAKAGSELRKSFAAKDWTAAFAVNVKPYGLRADDAADALAAHWVMAWSVANGVPSVSRASALAVRRQLAGGFARTAFAGATDTKLQRLADESIVNFVVLGTVGKWARGADKTRLADATQRNFAALGVDLRGLKLTDAGFVKA